MSILKATKEMIDIGNKWGLMMHDPIQSYHIANAMEDYKNKELEGAISLLKHCSVRMEEMSPRYNSSIEMVNEFIKNNTVT